MANGRHIPPPYEDHSTPAAGMASYGLLPASMDILESKLVSQAAEIEQFITDNHHLASTHVTLKHDLSAVHEEIEKLREHVRSIRTESDIQIRVILDKMAKKEGEVQAADSIKKDVEQSLNEARNLVTMIQKLGAKFKPATEELEKARLEVKKLPKVRAELENLQQEHQRLRETFEFEKGKNIAKVEQMKLLETDLVAKATEVERLRTELINAGRRTQAINTYGQSYVYPPPPMHASTPYMDGYGIPLAQITGEGAVPYGTGGTAPVGPRVGGVAAPPNPAWGPY